MTRIDQFASAFRAAAKTRFHYKPTPIQTVLMVTDLNEYDTKLFADRMRAYLAALGDHVNWIELPGDRCRTVGALLDAIEKFRPDLIITYRNLHSGGWRWPYSLGEHLDVLTQVTTTPVLVVPRPDQKEDFHSATESTSEVMVITDHLTGDDHLVNTAVTFTQSDGTLFLSHVEDQAIFDRYADLLGKIPSIETDAARDAIHEQLLKEPRDYIDSCVEQLHAANLSITVEQIVVLGHYLADYKKLLEEHAIGLLVLNTKDDDQFAMHGLAYPLAIELRQTSLLML